MQTRTKRGAVLTYGLAGLACLVLLAGCASYYKVTDPATGKEYFTEEYDRARGGHIVFQDARTGSEVTLQSSEVQEISKDTYKANVGKP
jgi:hypothetical protein